ncbi:MAG: hypothetical protein IJF71_06430, partial [Clostridia bacterium]|nr:hypothetical protein [Clostridia bacterium]
MRKLTLWILSFVCVLALSVCMGISTALADSALVIMDSDALVESNELYNTLDVAKGKQKLQNINGVVSSSGDGHMLYDAEIDGVDLNLRFTSGTSTFIVLRATKECAIWDGGLGYYLMLEKKGNDTTVQIIKGVKETANGDFVTLKSSKVTGVDIYDGEKHNIRYVAEEKNGTVTLTATIDGKEPIVATDSETICPKQGTHFVILSASNQVMYKLYSSTGEDITYDDAEYATLTGKTMLKKASNWSLDGSLYENGTVKGSRDQSKALFNRELKNVVYDIDIEMNIVSSSWLAIYLNANRSDVPWNTGFRSVMVRFEPSAIHIEYWNPQLSIAVIDRAGAGISYGEKMNIKVGMFDIETKQGNQTVVYLEINGKEIHKEPLAIGSVSMSAGYFGLVNYGLATYTLYPTAHEVDDIPSATDGIKLERADESNVTKEIATDDFAIIANSFNPYYSVDGGTMKVDAELTI